MHENVAERGVLTVWAKVGARLEAIVGIHAGVIVGIVQAGEQIGVVVGESEYNIALKAVSLEARLSWGY